MIYRPNHQQWSTGTTPIDPSSPIPHLYFTFAFPTSHALTTQPLTAYPPSHSTNSDAQTHNPNPHYCATPPRPRTLRNLRHYITISRSPHFPSLSHSRLITSPSPLAPLLQLTSYYVSTSRYPHFPTPHTFSRTPLTSPPLRLTNTPTATPRPMSRVTHR